MEIKNGRTEYIWKNLDRTNKTGKEYDYTIKEVLVPKNYDSKVETVKSDKENIEFKITNTYVSPKINIKGNIIWNFGPDEKPDAIIKLYENNKEVDNVTLKNGETSFEFKNKNIFDENGNLIEYKVKQYIDSKNYSKKYNLGYDIKYDSNIRKIDSDNIENDEIFEIQNTYVVLKKKVTTKKLWIGAGDDKTDITLTLFKNGLKEKEGILHAGEEKYTFDNLDLTDSNGNIYKYEVDEIVVPEGFIKKKSKTGNTIINVKDEVKEKYIPFAGNTKSRREILLIAVLSIYAIIFKKKKNNKYDIGI